MNSAELQILIRARDEASKTLGDIDKKAGGLGKTLGDVGKIAGGFVIGYGIMQAPGLLMSAAQAAADDAASVAKLQKAVENSGASWDTYSGQLNTVIETSMKRGFTDDETRDALALLTAQTGDAGEAARRFALAQDLARGANIDVYTASKLLGKVTEENVNVLARYGIKAREGMGEAELFGMLQEKFGGQAEVFANSTAGQMANAKIQMQELKESIGYAILPALTKLVDVVTTRLIPAMQKFVAEWGPKLQEAFKQAKEAIQPFIDALRGPLKEALAFIGDHKEVIVGALAGMGVVLASVLVPATIAWAAATVAAAVAMIVATWPILAVVAAGALLALGIKELIDHWDAIKAAIMRFWEYVEPVAKVMAVLLLAPFLPLIAAIVLTIKHFDDIKAAIGAVYDFVNEKFGILLAPIKLWATETWTILTFAWEVIKTLFVANLQAIWASVQFIFDEIKIVISTALGVLTGIFDFGLAILKGDWAGAWEALKGIVDTFKTGVIDTIANLLGFLATLGTLMLGVIGDLASLLYDVGKKVIQGLWDGMKDKWEDAKEWVADLGGKIAKLKGPIEVDAQLLMPHGKALMAGLRAGLLEGWRPISLMLPQMAPALAGGLAGGSQSVTNQGHTLNMYGGTINIRPQSLSTQDIWAQLEARG